MNKPENLYLKWKIPLWWPTLNTFFVKALKHLLYFVETTLNNWLCLFFSKAAKGIEDGCFEDKFWVLCGNGAHEEGEICDCGTVETCKESCCTPYGSKTGQPCTLRSEAYECSPSRGIIDF